METFSKIPIEKIVPGDNDRTVFEENALRELSESIKAKGLIEPIIVRPVGCQVINGEK